MQPTRAKILSSKADNYINPFCYFDKSIAIYR
jgi:hypothetical protein